MNQLLKRVVRVTTLKFAARRIGLACADRGSSFDILFDGRFRSRVLTIWAASLLSVAHPATTMRAELILGVPTNLGRNVNTSSFELLSGVSHDQLTLYYNSPALSRTNSGRLRVSTRASAEDQFGRPTALDTEIFPVGSWGSVSADSQSFVFSNSSESEFGGADLYVATRQHANADWSSATNMGSIVNSAADEEQPFLTADGLALYFSDGRAWAGQQQRPNGMGGADIWVSHRSSLEAPFQPPENLGSTVNGPEDDGGASLTSDGLQLFFVSRRDGGYGGWDLWMSSRDDVAQAWKAPINLGPTVNGAGDDASGHVSRDGRMLYFTSDRPGGFGGLDLWQIPLLQATSIALDGSGATYFQDFDEALGVDGDATGTSLPRGWTSSEDGNIYGAATTKSFPAGSSLGRVTPIYNAGEDQDADRALALGVTGRADRPFLQLLADVTEHDATSVQLQFDMEVWDAARRNVETLGEAAFDITMEIDTGEGFTELLNLGTASTGASLFPPAGDTLNGNADANRMHFDSMPHDVSIPAGSKLRIRWEANQEVPSTGWVFGLDNVALSVFGQGTDIPLQPGDADQDFDFDQLDLVRVQIANKYLTGQTATWGEGDWNGGTGGAPGDPPPGDGFFNQLDVVAALSAGTYLSGPYAAVQPSDQTNDSHTSVIYNAGTGELSLEVQVGSDLTAINIDSAAGIFTGQPAANLGGSFDHDADGNIFKSTFGGSFGSLSFGQVAQAGLSEDFVLRDLNVIGSLAGRGVLNNVSLVYVPEPTSLLLLSIGLAIRLVQCRSFNPFNNIR